MNIEVRAVAWHSPELQKVRCVTCGPPANETSLESVTEASNLRPNPVGGSAAIREGRLRHDPKWVKGAAGEYITDRALHRVLNEGVEILTDRLVPGTKYNIDHVVIAPSGVWIIDSKNWAGKIEYKAQSLLSMNMRLIVGGKDRTSEVEAMYKQIIPVAQEIVDSSVPLNAAMTFVDGDWSLTSLPRLLANKPYRHLDVWITPLRPLAKMINEPGPLEPAAVQQLASQLNAALKPA
ncbi:MAG TPA: nuclease-related domain-containing protein [Acidimicrobiales bacterium]|nr:nuclease-related domain-containing protein [Acidimicrobiales bacterium]HUZ42338.1 nuclease-related domain-containing protein [Acidimicrobiales bacterium]